MIVFDIETGPQDRAAVLSVVGEFPPYQPPGEFDKSQVKLGNLKDPAKIAEKIQAAAEAHAKMVSESRGKWEADKLAYEAKAMDKAALSALTGQVLAVGYHNPMAATPTHIEMQSPELTERQLIERFWKRWERSQGGNGEASAVSWVGWNIHKFDMPFLVQRSRIIGIPVPDAALAQGVYWHPSFIDLMPRWTCSRSGYQKLGHVAVALGMAGKAAVRIEQVNGDGEAMETAVDGSMFAKLWAEDPLKAHEYLANDLKMTTAVAERLGVQ